MFTHLLSSRRFAPIFWCQFFAALNDNFVKTALSFLVIYKLGAEEGKAAIAMAPVALMAPSFLLSAFGGQIADRFDKAIIARYLKLSEIPIAALAAAGFYFDSIPMLFAALTGFGIIVALFGPIKYGILPVHLRTDELAPGNALVEGATFLAILLGTIMGGTILSSEIKGGKEFVDLNPGMVPIVALSVLAIGILSWIATLFIPRTGSAAPNLKIIENPVASTWQILSGGESNSVSRAAVFYEALWLIIGIGISFGSSVGLTTFAGVPQSYRVTLLTFVVSIVLGAVTAVLLKKTWHLLGDLKSDRRIWQGALINNWFWLVGALVLTLLPVLVKDLLNGAPAVSTATLLTFTVSIAVGSMLAAIASKSRPNLAVVPIGAAIIGLTLLHLAWTSLSIVPPSHLVSLDELLHTNLGRTVFIDLSLLAVGGGLFVVPSFAAVQAWAPEDRKARVIAGCNVLSAAYITAGSLTVSLLHASLPAVFAGLGLSTLFVAGLVVRVWGRTILKDSALMLFRTVLRLEVTGEENLPPAGTRAVIAPNHVSLVDPPIIHAVMPAHTTYAIDTGMSQRWWIKPFLRFVNWHSIDPTRPMGMRDLINGVKAGEQLVIFPEGRLSTTGSLMKVYDGTALIADKADAVVVPVRIEGPERTKGWSYLRPSQIKKVWFPKTKVAILPAVKLAIDPALRGKARRLAAGSAMQDIMINAAVATAPMNTTLFEALGAAKAVFDTGTPIVEDPLGTKLTYGRLITGAQVLGAKIAPMTKPGEAVGVLLPNSAGVAVVFFALQSIARVAAMLNFSSGTANVIGAVKTAKINTVLTSRAFIDKARLGDLVAALEKVTKVVYLDDVRTSITAIDKIAGVMKGVRPQVACKPDDPAAILFTSGSEGTPKGVVLSHKNMLANVYQVLKRMDVNGEDKVFNALPVFHSFGLTGGCVMPIIGGIPVHLYPTPLHYRIIPELTYQTNATILFGTDTFLNGYARSAHPYDLAKVRMVISGAEAVKERTRQVYMEKFGARILEGYGVTEAAPVVSVNTPMANRSGSVGRLSPLLEARLEPVAGVIDGGRLLLRGPNIMLGYYRAENPGVLEPPPGGWYDTGDIVAIDQQGFVSIKGRLKRFAKIGGEMISLAAVEALAAELWPNLITVVVAEPDARKGERLVLLTTDAKCTRQAFQQFAKSRGATELMVPAEIMVVDTIPLLGSGKPDFVAATKLAAARAAAPIASDAARPSPPADVPAPETTAA